MLDHDHPDEGRRRQALQAMLDQGARDLAGVSPPPGVARQGVGDLDLGRASTASGRMPARPTKAPSSVRQIQSPKP